MKIRTRLALQFTIIVASILLLFSLSIYYLSSSFREQQFYSRLEDKAYNTGKLLMNVEEVNYDLFKIIDSNTVSLYLEQIIVFDSNNELLYKAKNNDSLEVNSKLLNKIRKEKKVKYKDHDKEVLGLLYTSNSDEVVIIISAFDKYGLGKLSNLKWVLIAALAIFTIITMIMGWLYAGQALSPISNVIEQVDDISASDLSKRVTIKNEKDEIAQLANTFNNMLQRLEKAFRIQKSFVSNASHELRTPLTSVTGHIEVALMKERTKEEYQSVLMSLLEDMKNLNKLSNGLLALMQTENMLSKVSSDFVRVDELIWQVRNELLKFNPEYNITIQIKEFTEDESKLVVYGNEFLLKSAIMNLMDNACKFSQDHSVTVLFSTKEQIELSFIDKGIGIPEEELKEILEPFYRSKNAKSYPGHGIGLSLTHKIIAMHKGEFSIISKENEGTTVIVSFPFLIQ